jgi:hypothetical protein
MNWTKWLGVASLSMVLAACSGGGGCASADACTAGPGAGPGTTTAVVSDIVLTLDKNQVSNSAATDVKLTVQAVDANRNAVVGAVGIVSLSDVPGGATVGGGPFVTSDQGSFVANIATGAIKTDRSVTVNAQVGAVRSSVGFNIVGSKLAVSLTPGQPLAGSTVTLNVSLKDASDGNIPNQTVAISGIPGVSGSVTTDANGQGTFPFVAPAAAGSYALQAVGSGVTTVSSFDVIAAGGSTPPAVGPVAASALGAVPAVVGVNVPGSTSNRTTLRAVFLRANNQPIQNVRVRFEIIDPPGSSALGAGEFLVSGTSVKLTDVSGVAETDYVSGTRSSPTNGVWVRACFDVNDFAASACPNLVTTSFTVAANPLSITLGDNNELEKVDSNLNYLKRFVVVVADSAGQPVPNAQVSFSVDIFKYGKGSVSQPYPTDVVLGSGTIVRIAPLDNRASDVGGGGLNSWCVNEDANRNGQIELGEDINNTGAHEPRKADITLQAAGGTNRTDANGVIILQARYPQNVATWLAYTVKVSASVQGSEGTVSKRYITDAAQADAANGSFLTPPYGANPSCSSPQ